jgi:NAD+ kinase
MKKILLVVHPDRNETVSHGKEFLSVAKEDGFEVLSNRPDIMSAAVEYKGELDLAAVVVFGGDGTILRAAQIARGTNAPIIGVNLGKVGFLAEISNPSAFELVAAISKNNIAIEPRLTLTYKVLRDGQEVGSGWALNEIVVERSETTMVELFLQIDNRPLSRWGCDAVICATPTGSTAYAFSAGGPVVWPQVDAMVILPLAAHALFSDPMVVSPNSNVVIDIESKSAEISADGMRRFPVQENDRILISKDSWQANLAHVDKSVFTDRLVAKFKLPIEGWRGAR